MLRLLLTLVAVCSLSWATAQPVIAWADVAGSSNFNDETLDMGTDADGNRYVVGYFAENFTYDLSVNTLASGNNRTGAFVVKFDTAGTVLWQRSLGNNNSNLTGGARADGIAVTSAGDVVVVGQYSGEVAEDGQDTALFNNSTEQMFVWRLDPNGTTNWIKATESAAGLHGRKVDFGANNDIYVAGIYDGGSGSTLNLDLDDNTNTAANLTGNAFDDLYVAHYNSSGAFQKAQRAAGGEGESILDLDYTAADGGKVAISGFTGSMGELGFDDDLTSDNLNFVGGSRNGFHVVYNATLTFDYGIAVNNSANVIATGVHFDDNTGKLWALGTAFGNGVTSYGDTDGPDEQGTNEDPYIMLVSTDGSIDFVNQYSSQGGDRALGLDVDSDGNAYMSGWVADTLDMGNGFEYISTGGQDAFMMVVDQTGTTTFGTGYGGAGAERAQVITVDAFGHVATGGPNEDSFSIGSVAVDHFGSRDAYIAFFRNPDANNSSRQELLNAGLSIYPNPTSGTLKLAFSDAVEREVAVSVLDMTGRTVATHTIAPHSQNVQMNLDNLSTGVYLLRLQAADWQGTQRIVVE